mgnify:CR=1 FL=1
MFFGGRCEYLWMTHAAGPSHPKENKQCMMGFSTKAERTTFMVARAFKTRFVRKGDSKRAGVATFRASTRFRKKVSKKTGRTTLWASMVFKTRLGEKRFNMKVWETTPKASNKFMERFIRR